MIEITKEEREAEVIFILTNSNMIDKELFIYMAKHLENRLHTSSVYLQL